MKPDYAIERDGRRVQRPRLIGTGAVAMKVQPWVAYADYLEDELERALAAVASLSRQIRTADSEEIVILGDDLPDHEPIRLVGDKGEQS